MIRNLASLLCLLFCLLGLAEAWAQGDDANGSTTFRFLDSNYHGEPFSQESIIQSIRKHFDLSNYREVRIAVTNDQGGTPYLLLQLLSRKFHRVDIARVDLNKTFDFQAIQNDYKMTPQDYKNQFKVDSVEPLPEFHLRLSNLQCPTQDAEFLTFAPNGDEPTEQTISKDVAAYAAQHGLKEVTLLAKDATHDKLIGFLKCPYLKGVFYDGDANPTSITTYDGVLQASEIAQNFKFGKKVTHIWLACQAFNDPMLSTMIASVEAQKYAAGINDLQIGSSDRAAACAMKAALDGQPMTAAFWHCYTVEDKPTGNWVDKWGFDGRGSDLFGHPPQTAGP
jgi:hypothetical protein